MLVSGLLPRRLAAFGIGAGALAVVAATGALLDVYDRQSGPQILLTLPEMIWEATFGIYLVARGFTRPAMVTRSSPLDVDAGLSGAGAA
jgi:hypothetical protein